MASSKRALKNKGITEMRNCLCVRAEVELKGEDPARSEMQGLTVAQWMAQRSLWGHTDTTWRKCVP